MTHRAESIMQAVTTAVTGLATTGANVTRGRAYPVAALPALSVFQAEESILGDIQSSTRVTRELIINIEIHVQATTQLETIINAIRAEVYAALMADRTQGLAYVIDTQWQDDSQPEIDGENETPVARVLMRWAITYQHSLTSAES